MKKLDNRFTIFSLAFSLWAAYALLYFSTKANLGFHPIAGYLSLVGETGLDILAGYLAFKIYRVVHAKENKIIFYYFFLSFIFAVMADAIYNVMLNLYHIQYDNTLIVSIFDSPFAAFLFLQAFAWKRILSLNNSDKKNPASYSHIPFIIIPLLIFFIFMFISSWKIKYFSLVGIFQFIDTILEVIGFSLATLCLASSKANYMFFTATGYLLIVSSDLSIRFNVINGITPFLNPYETTWVLGLISICYGFFLNLNSKRTNEILLSPINSLQSQIATWLLIPWFLTILFYSFYLFILSDTHSYEKIFFNVIFISIPLYILPIAVSNFISKKLAAPLIGIEKIINDFTHSKENNNVNERISGNYIDEFILFEKFTKNALLTHKKNHNAEIEFAKTASQISHDIRSPLMALSLATQKLNGIKDGHKNIIFSTIERISEIADNLLYKHRITTKQITSITPLLNSI